MALSDCFSPEELAREIHTQCPNLTPPIPVTEIALAAGIKEIVPFPEPIGVEGMMVAPSDKNEGIILFNPESPMGRQRFTIAHELGHFLMIWHNGTQLCSSNDMNRKLKSSERSKHEVQEDEANRFAQALLMPDELLLKEVGSESLCLREITKIAERFDLSFSAIANRLSGLAPRPFALVYSHKGLVKYCFQDFYRLPFKLNLKKGDPLPLPFLAHDQVDKPRFISDKAPIDIGEWCGAKCSVYQQAYTQENGYQVTLLEALEL